MEDELSKKIIGVIKSSDEPIETKEIEQKIKGVSRDKVLYRLFNLRGEGVIKGKQVGSGKGTWIWWKR